MDVKPKGTVREMAKGGTWLAISAVLINLLQLASVIIVAWFLSPDDYGLVAIAMTFLVILSSITDMFLGEALIRQKEPSKKDIDTIWTMGVIRGVLIALIFLVLAYPVARFYGDDRLVGLMLALGLSPLSLGFQNPYRFLQQKKLVFSQEFIITVLQKLLSVATIIGIAAIFHSYWALIIGNIVFFASGTIISFILNPYRPAFNLRGWREVMNFSGWVMLSQIVSMLNSRFELLLMGRILGMATLGLYTMGSNLAWMATDEIMKPLRKVIFPAFTRVLHSPQGQQDPERLRQVYQRTQSLVTALVLPISVGFAVAAEPLIHLVFSERWYPVIFILQYLSAVFGFQTLGSLVRPLGKAKGQTRRLFVRDTQMLLLRLPIIIASMVAWGVVGIIIARVFTGLLSIAVNLFLIREFIGLPVRAQLYQNLRAIFGVTVMGAAMFVVGQGFDVGLGRAAAAEMLAAEVLAGGLAYALAICLSWMAMGRPEGPEREFIRLLGGLLRRRATA